MSTHAAIAANASRAVPGYLVSAIAMTPAAGLPALQPRSAADPLAALGHAKVYDRDMTVFSEGDAAGSVFRVQSGMVRLHKMLPDGRRQIIGFLHAGDMMGLAFAAQYLYTAEAVTATTIQRIPRLELDVLLDAQPALARKLLSATTSELMAAQDQMVLLGRKTAAEKVASFLLRLCDRKGGDRTIDLPMGRSDIADHLGLTTETVSRTFTKLKSARLIRILVGGKLELLDHDALADLAGGF
ncbi:Crp/Fnr family transcriptional regulator [Azospirillum thiophilum]|uniref:Crp/Fnr family transcriptional regulator n=1 Tax=Azospirillum thiophilum TaxID=528244 RepID=A0AAC8W4F4_9PROT|nr:helix-turn-helix domain-containing protein [Azospirillum thiophilum]ALG74706.1 Crp/Fnr family transcriptional regulator [Azospirillum thiophilum]KJR61536.1 Crp/Fnr family transcriptional regulator [Azospirillum thiophilum]